MYLSVPSENTENHIHESNEPEKIIYYHSLSSFYDLHYYNIEKKTFNKRIGVNIHPYFIISSLLHWLQRIQFHQV